jgi:hypothetical protein
MKKNDLMNTMMVDSVKKSKPIKQSDKSQLKTMSKETAIKLFEEKQVRTVWDAEQEKWYISIVDVIGILTDSIDPNAYWRKLKQRLKEEGNETVTNCHGLKMLAVDGKMRMTDVAKVARMELESKTGKKVVSELNAKSALKSLTEQEKTSTKEKGHNKE